MNDDDLDIMFGFEAQIEHISRLWGPAAGERMQLRRQLVEARELVVAAALQADFARGKLEVAIIQADGMLMVTEIAKLAGRSRRAIYDLVNTIE